MIVVLDPRCSIKHKAEIVRLVENEGFRVHVSESREQSLVGVIGGGAERLTERLSAMEGVVEVRSGGAPYPMVSREQHPRQTRVKVGEVVFGGKEVIVIAGPCSVEARDSLLETARAAAASGARMLRGGAFKPRSSPYSFQGLGEKGLELLAEAREATGLRVVTEVLAPEDVDLVARYTDMLQIGARNMQNFRLLTAVGEQARPVLLKRGMMATTEELLMAAEYVVSHGNPRVVLCERGIRTFETATRNTLDIAAVPVLKERTHLPLVIDPSHAAGIREWVPSLSLAAIAAGADGLIVEIHPRPEQAVSDGRQSLTLDGFDAMMKAARPVAGAVGRSLPPREEPARGESA